MTEVSKKVLRKAMLNLMGYDSSWQNDPEKSSQIKAIGRCLYSDKISDKKPLPRLDADNYTRSDYEKHLSQGYLVNDIKSALGLGSHRFQEWRISVGLISKKSTI